MFLLLFQINSAFALESSSFRIHEAAPSNYANAAAATSSSFQVEGGLSWAKSPIASTSFQIATSPPTNVAEEESSPEEPSESNNGGGGEGGGRRSSPIDQAQPSTEKAPSVQVATSPEATPQKTPTLTATVAVQEKTQKVQEAQQPSTPTSAGPSTGMVKDGAVPAPSVDTNTETILAEAKSKSTSDSVLIGTMSAAEAGTLSRLASIARFNNIYRATPVYSQAQNMVVRSLGTVRPASVSIGALIPPVPVRRRRKKKIASGK